MRREIDCVTVPIGLVLDNGNTAKEARDKGITLPVDVPDHAVYMESGFEWMAMDVEAIQRSTLLRLPLKKGDKVKIQASTWENGIEVSRSPIGETGSVRHVHPEDGSIYVHLPDRYLWFNRSDLELVPA